MTEETKPKLCIIRVVYEAYALVGDGDDIEKLASEIERDEPRQIHVVGDRAALEGWTDGCAVYHSHRTGDGNISLRQAREMK